MFSAFREYRVADFRKQVVVFAILSVVGASFAPTAVARKCPSSTSAIKKMMIKDSTARYSGSCPCPYSRTKRGHKCGKRSAWSRPGGASPLCYPDDVSPKMIRRYCG